MMFCNQCEETVKGTGCTVKGVCGKEDDTAAYQDVLVYLFTGIAVRNLAAMERGSGDPDAGLLRRFCSCMRKAEGTTGVQNDNVQE